MEKDLQDLADMQCKVELPEYVSPEEELVRACIYRKEAGKEASIDPEFLRDFVLGWRRLLVDTLKPSNLPTGWSLDAPVMSSRKEAESKA